MPPPAPDAVRDSGRRDPRPPSRDDSRRRAARHRAVGGAGVPAPLPRVLVRGFAEGRAALVFVTELRRQLFEHEPVQLTRLEGPPHARASRTTPKSAACLAVMDARPSARPAGPTALGRSRTSERLGHRGQDLTRTQRRGCASRPSANLGSHQATHWAASSWQLLATPTCEVNQVFTISHRQNVHTEEQQRGDGDCDQKRRCPTGNYHTGNCRRRHSRVRLRVIRREWTSALDETWGPM